MHQVSKFKNSWILAQYTKSANSNKGRKITTNEQVKNNNNHKKEMVWHLGGFDVSRLSKAKTGTSETVSHELSCRIAQRQNRKRKSQGRSRP